MSCPGDIIGVDAPDDDGARIEYGDALAAFFAAYLQCKKENISQK